MNKDDLSVWLMRTALEKIIHSRCVCNDNMDDLTQIGCCPSCLAKHTLTTIDGYNPHANKTIIENEFVGT